jgi:hypothetical protein
MKRCKECVRLHAEIEDLGVILRLNPRITYAQAREIQYKGVEYVRKIRRERDAARQLAWGRGKMLLDLRYVGGDYEKLRAENFQLRRELSAAVAMLKVPPQADDVQG